MLETGQGAVPGEAPKLDSGLACLAMLLRFHGMAADPAQISHQFGGAAIGVTEMLRSARDFKIKARAVMADWDRLTRLTLPGIVELNDGTFAIAGQVAADKVLIQAPAAG